MAQVKWTPQAIEDLEAICLFISREAPHIGAVFVDSAFRVTDRLALPRSGRIVPKLEIDNIREIILGNYRLFYCIREDQVEILTVDHGARLLDIGKINA